MIPKNKPVRLKGKALAQLNADIHKRDKDKCIIPSCGVYVDPGVKFHHEPQGAKKEDRIEKGVVLCPTCHDTRHHGKEGSQEIRQHCEWYLEALYCWARDSELCINCENQLCECKKESPEGLVKS